MNQVNDAANYQYYDAKNSGAIEVTLVNLSARLEFIVGIYYEELAKNPFHWFTMANAPQRNERLEYC
jgi:hypothetical protein